MYEPRRGHGFSSRRAAPAPREGGMSHFQLRVHERDRPFNVSHQISHQSVACIMAGRCIGLADRPIHPSDHRPGQCNVLHQIINHLVAFTPVACCIVARRRQRSVVRRQNRKRAGRRRAFHLFGSAGSAHHPSAPKRSASDDLGQFRGRFRRATAHRLDPFFKSPARFRATPRDSGRFFRSVARRQLFEVSHY